MNMQRVLKQAAFVLVLFCSAMSNATITWAAAFPERVIRLIVPFPPGGSTDIVARIIAEPLGKELGQSVIVQNKAGAGGSLGALSVAQSLNDGYTIGIASNSTHIANPLLQKDTAYDPVRDFTSLGGIATVANVLVINPKKINANNMAELLALAKKHPGRYTCASAGSGSMGHLWLASFEYASNTNIPHLPFRGAAPALNNVLSGQADMMFDNLPSTLPYIKDNRLLPIAVAAFKRSEALPNVPTFTELGLDDANLAGWFGLVGPAGIPAVITKQINDALLKIMKDPAVISALKEQGAEAAGTTPQVFSSNLKLRLDKARALVNAGKISLD